MLYLKKTPWILKKLYPDRVWKMNTTENILYLTFDDGPHPEITLFVLDQLKKHNAKATFFCIGKNVEKNFSVYEQVLAEGHKTGNHTFRHLNGWKTQDKIYLDDISDAAKIIDSNLFRPPYGRITRFQSKAISGGNLLLKTIMWDVLSGDFDLSVSGENCYLNVINNVEPGSIIVFHDSTKAFKALRYALPRILEYYSEKEFQFRILNETGL
ncbi:MAG: polysaccharide deacetylase family protein [Ginsengibacter sp.]